MFLVNLESPVCFLDFCFSYSLFFFENPILLLSSLLYTSQIIFIFADGYKVKNAKSKL